MAPTKKLQDQLFEEIKGRVQETDVSAPVPWDGWWYYSRTVEGLQYPIHCRRRAPNGEEEILLDENRLAEGLQYLSVGAVQVSPDHRLAAFAMDTTGDISFTVRVRDLATGELLPDRIDNVFGGIEWAADSRTLFYAEIDDAHRSWRLRRHTLGAPVEDDLILFQEDDDRFWLWLDKSRDGRVLTMHSTSKVTSEAWLVDAENTDELHLVEARRQGVEYHVEAGGDRLLIVTNDGAENFKLMEASRSSPGRENWRDLLAHRPDVKVEAVDAFARHLAVYERADALQRIRILHPDGRDELVEQAEPVYAASAGPNLEYETDVLRFSYTSLVTPHSDVDLHVATGERTVVKRQPVLGGYEPDDYVTERLWATADDGERVAVSVVHRRDVALDGSAPALLYGYGSYEDFYLPEFSIARLSLLQRGWVVGIAHVRGGGEMGRRWYENGKLLHKTNTFTDFIRAAEHLVAEGYTSPDRLAARGASAGGLLMGAVANLRPDLFRAVVAQVPFVDVINTMLDETIPLTVTEWEEWGNPNDPEVYALMRRYTPYENVEAKEYPAMLVTAGINDSQVQYWEPAKWVAKLRATRTDDDPLLLKTEMGAGHAGPSGRYETWREEAFVLAFLLTVVGGGP